MILTPCLLISCSPHQYFLVYFPLWVGPTYICRTDHIASPTLSSGLRANGKWPFSFLLFSLLQKVLVSRLSTILRDYRARFLIHPKRHPPSPPPPPPIVFSECNVDVLASGLLCEVGVPGDSPRYGQWLSSPEEATFTSSPAPSMVRNKMMAHSSRTEAADKHEGTLGQS